MSDDGNDSKNTETEEKSLPTSPSHVVETKIDVLLKPAGDAPIMKKKKWAVDRNKRIGWVGEFIKKYLKLTAQDSVFLYVNQSFAPTPDTEIGSVFEWANLNQTQRKASLDSNFSNEEPNPSSRGDNGIME